MNTRPQLVKSGFAPSDPVASPTTPQTAPSALRVRRIYADGRAAQREWGGLTVAERMDRLKPLGSLLVHRMSAIAERIVRENGKPEFEAITHEIGVCVAALDHLSRTAPDVLSGRAESNVWLPFRRATVTPRPFGCVLIIAPWNVPLAIPLTQVLTGLAAGNAVVLKPSEVTPDIGALIGDLLGELNLPEALVQVVHGDGATGAALVAAGPDKVFFTGSVATGRRVMQAAASTPRLTPVCLELGGVDALIVCDDADLDFAASAATWGGLFNGGQVCASVERVLVHHSVVAPLVARMAERIERLDPQRDLGRITAERQKNVYDGHIADARARGLTLLTGGQYTAADQLAPTLVVGDGIEGSQVWQQESFGPIIAVAVFDDDDDAIRKHNDTPFGLTASVFAGDEARAAAIAQRLVAGAVALNDVAATLYARAELPWGGVGSSGFGRSHGREGLLEFTWPQVLDRPTVWGLDFKRPWWFPYDADGAAAMRSFTRAVAARGPVERLTAVARVGRHVLGQLARQPRH